MAASKKTQVRVMEASEDNTAAAALLIQVDPLDDRETASQRSLWLDWLFRKNPLNMRLQIIAERDGVVVGHLGAVPLAFELKGRRAIGCFVAQQAIERKAASGLLFFRSQQSLARAARTAGASFLYALVARRHIVDAHLRIGWKYIGDLPVLARPANLEALAGQLIENRPLAAVAKGGLRCLSLLTGLVPSLRPPPNIDLREISPSDVDLSVFVAANVRKNINIAYRDADVFKWRYQSYKGRQYTILAAYESEKLVGFAALRPMKMERFDTLAIVDLETKDDSLAIQKYLISEIVARARREGRALVTTIAPGGDNVEQAFRKRLFLRAPRKFMLLVKPLDDILLDDIGGIDRWRVSWFDNDVV